MAINTNQLIYGVSMARPGMLGSNKFDSSGLLSNAATLSIGTLLAVHGEELQHGVQ